MLIVPLVPIEVELAVLIVSVIKWITARVRNFWKVEVVLKHHLYLVIT